MRILRISPYFYEKKENIDGGLKPYYYNLILTLKKYKITHQIITADSDSFENKNIFKIRKRKRLNYLLMGYDAYKIIRKNKIKYDIIHVHNPIFFLLFHYKNRLGKIVYTNHGSPFAIKYVPAKTIADFKDMLYNYIFNRYICKRADAIILLSNQERDRVIKNYKIDKNNVYYIPTAADTRIFKPKNIKKDIDIIYAGRFAVKKNIPLLLKIIKDLKVKLPNIKVILIGGKKDDKDYKLIKSLIKTYNIEKNVEIVPKVPQVKLANYYSRAKIFALMSFEEGMPKVLLEAMSCACIGISTKGFGMDEIIEDQKNGFLVDLKWDYKKIYNVFEKALLNYNPKLGKEATKKINSNFTWDIVSKNMLGIYKKLAP